MLKLLYFAEREALAEYGSSITGSTFSSLEHGPVSSDVYSLIQGTLVWDRWSCYLENDGPVVCLKREPSNDHLCEADEELIRKHWDAHAGTFDPSAFPKALVAYSHTLPEWKKPPAQGSIPILQRSVWAAQGVSSKNMDTFELWDDAAMSLHRRGESNA